MPATASASTMSCRAIASGWSRLRSPTAWSLAASLRSLWPMAATVKPEFWLSAGWDAVKANGWRAPLYWTKKDGAWSIFTLRGELPLEQLEAAPVSHVSYLRGRRLCALGRSPVAHRVRVGGCCRRPACRRQSARFGAADASPSTTVSSKTRTPTSGTGIVGCGRAAPIWAIRDLDR